MRQDIFQSQDDGREDADDAAPPAPGGAGAGGGAGGSAEGGAVSDVQNLGDGGPIQPDQATAGSPDPEVQEGTAGPNARATHDRPGLQPEDPDGPNTSRVLE